MILEQITQLLALKIRALGFVSRPGALAREVHVKIGRADIVRRLPGAMIAPFEKPDLFHLAPDARESAITWFEAGPTRVVRQGASMVVMENEIRLMMWLNSKRIAGEIVTAEMSIVAAVRHFLYNPDDSYPLRSLEIEYLGDIPGEPIRLLSRWDFNEAENQLTLYPYRVACHRFLVTYATGLGHCASGVMATNPIC
jgi:hypothetical protein